MPITSTLALLTMAGLTQVVERLRTAVLFYDGALQLCAEPIPDKACNRSDNSSVGERIYLMNVCCIFNVARANQIQLII